MAGNAGNAHSIEGKHLDLPSAHSHNTSVVQSCIPGLWSVRKDDTHKSEPEHLCTCSAGIL